ncbi:MAG: hypothetical protein ACYC5G_00565 [Candidatus Doudnabacteria bacterium]
MTKLYIYGKMRLQLKPAEEYAAVHEWFPLDVDGIRSDLFLSADPTTITQDQDYEQPFEKDGKK